VWFFHGNYETLLNFMWINVMQKQHTLWNFNAEALRPWPTWMWYYNVGICSAKALHFVEFYADIFTITWSIKNPCFKFLKILKIFKNTINLDRCCSYGQKRKNPWCHIFHPKIYLVPIGTLDLPGVDLIKPFWCKFTQTFCKIDHFKT